MVRCSAGVLAFTAHVRWNSVINHALLPPNDKAQQLTAKRLTTQQDVIASLLQRLVSRSFDVSERNPCGDLPDTSAD